MSQPPGGNSPRSHGIASRYVRVKGRGRRHYGGSPPRRRHNAPSDQRIRLGAPKSNWHRRNNWHASAKQRARLARQQERPVRRPR